MLKYIIWSGTDMKKIYLVVLDWSTDDCSDVDIEAFDTYEKALNRFKEWIEDEKENIDWIHSAFDENGEILPNYEFDEHWGSENGEYPCWWDITDANDWYNHDFLGLRIVEVK